jgi:hypothetical protein
MIKHHNHYGITRYELIKSNGWTHLRFYATDPRFVKGYSNIESLPTETPKESTLALLRKQGKFQSASFGVEFVDHTVQS